MWPNISPQFVHLAASRPKHQPNFLNGTTQMYSNVCTARKATVNADVNL